MSNMKNKILLSLAEEFDLYASDRNIFGVVENYSIEIIDAASSKMIALRLEKLDEEKQAKIRENVKPYVKELKCTRIEVGEYAIIITFDESNWKASKEKLKKAILMIIKIAKNEGLSPQIACQDCQTTENLRFYNTSGFGMILCEKCFPKAVFDIEKMAQEILAEKTNYPKAITAVLLLTTLGVGLTIFLAQFGTKAQFAGSMFIPVLAGVGYLNFGGKPEKRAPFILLAITAFQLGISTLGSIIIPGFEINTIDILNAVINVFNRTSLRIEFFIIFGFTMGWTLLAFFSFIKTFSKRPVPSITPAVKVHEANK